MNKAINIYPILERAINRDNYLKTPIVLKHIEFECEEEGIRSTDYIACEGIEDDTMYDTLNASLEKFAKKYPDCEMNPNCVDFHFDNSKTKKIGIDAMGGNTYKVVDATVTIFPKAEIEAYNDAWETMKNILKENIREQGVDCYCEYVK